MNYWIIGMRHVTHLILRKIKCELIKIMKKSLELIDIAAMFTHAADNIKANIDELSALDSAIGDGDHGITMARAAGAIRAAIKDPKSSNISELLSNIGWGVMSIDGGCTGPLLGSLFIGMGSGATDAEKLDINGLATIFEAGLENLQQQSAAKIGDKTMMDALIPAIEALRISADSGKLFNEAFLNSAIAAENGAIATKNMIARFGRAKNLKERTLGCQDPGATTISLLFKGFAEAVA